MRIFYGIDGTGNFDQSNRAIACRIPQEIAKLQQSHVKRIPHFGFDRSQYVRGTQDIMTGTSSGQKVIDAVNWLRQTYMSSIASKRDTKIYLSGFSRGGASALCIAHELQKLDIPVKAMFLFDAVDRSTSMDNAQTKIPPKNVEKAWHAIRNPSARSRLTFGNCGVDRSNGNLEVAQFITTHGGVGGWPNGQSRVKPGVGPEDFAYAAAMTSGLASALAARNDYNKRANNIHEDGEPMLTNIGPTQELKGMENAWKWMSANIAQAMRD